MFFNSILEIVQIIGLVDLVLNINISFELKYIPLKHDNENDRALLIVVFMCHFSYIKTTVSAKHISFCVGKGVWRLTSVSYIKAVAAGCYWRDPRP